MPQITALTADTSPTKDDLVVTVNDPAGTPATRKATIENFLKVINDLTAETTIDGADIVLIYDASAGAVRKMTRTNFVAGIGGGSMSSFSLSGDSGTPQTITDGNTLNIEGGTGIDTVAGATDKVTIAIDSTVATLDGIQTLTNKTITDPTITALDSKFTVQDNSDPTKQFKFQASGITAGQTRTVTIPDADITLIGTSGGTFSGDISVPDEAYGVGWNGSLEVPTKNAVYDKIETLGAGSGANTALSNLASVAINTSLISDTNNTDDLGSASIAWKDLYLAGGIRQLTASSEFFRLKDSSGAESLVVADYGDTRIYFRHAGATNTLNTVTNGTLALVDNGGAGFFQIQSSVKLKIDGTIAGSTGAQTINKCSGIVKFAAAATSLVVTNNKCDTNTGIIACVMSNDATMKSVQAVSASGSFTLYPDAAPTAETQVFFFLSGIS